MKSVVIFTDLDGTLLNSDNYCYEEALPGIEELKRRAIPLVITSSKTRSEIEIYRKRLSNRDPFIVENGGAIFVPEGYFSSEIISDYKPVRMENYETIILGCSYGELRAILEELKVKGFRVKGFGDLTVEEISNLTGLDKEEAKLSKEREFDEVFIIEDQTKEKEILDYIKERGYEYTRGEFYHIMGKSDKGKAVRTLIDMYRKKLGDIITIAIGDSMNDLPMLKEVQYPYIVKKRNGTYDKAFEGYTSIIRVDGIGPVGWKKAVFEILKKIDYFFSL